MLDLSAKYHIQRTLFSVNRYSAFEAVQRDFNRLVILNQIQLYYSDSSETLKHCEREIKLWSSLQHPNLPQPIDGWAEENRLVFIWLVPKGYSLESVILEKQNIEIDQGIEIAFQIASLMRYLHQQGLYHGSLSPACFTLCYGKWVKLIRTGLPAQINRIFEQAASGLKQEVNIERQKRSDLTNWGAIVGALFTSDPYFGYKKEFTPKPYELLLDELSLRQINPKVPKLLESIVLKALHSSDCPEKGYNDFSALCQDLAQLKESNFFTKRQKQI